MINREAKVNIGIIGPGRVAARHANAIAQCVDAQLWCIAGRDIESATKFSKTHQCYSDNAIYDDVKKMLSDPQLDAVIIATPDKLHAHHILLAVQENKSILVEKPLCTSRSECEQIKRVLQNKKNILAVAYHLRWHDGLRQLATKCHLKQLGQPIHLRLHWGVDFLSHQKWRINPKYSKWFCLTVLGTHLIDVMRWLLVPLCAEITEIKSIISNHHLKSEFEEIAVVLFKFESGATAEIYCSVTHDSPFKLELYASDAVVVGNELVSDNRNLIINGKKWEFLKNNPYVPQIENLVSAIKRRQDPEVGLNEGITNIKIMSDISMGGAQK